MKENTVVAFQNPSDFQKDPLTEVLQAGARELLAQAVEAEVSVFLGSHAALVDAAGRRRRLSDEWISAGTLAHPDRDPGPVSVRQPTNPCAGLEGTAPSASRLRRSVPRYLRRVTRPGRPFCHGCI